jgi:hypothetical protein
MMQFTQDATWPFNTLSTCLTHDGWYDKFIIDHEIRIGFYFDPGYYEVLVWVTEKINRLLDDDAYFITVEDENLYTDSFELRFILGGSKNDALTTERFWKNHGFVHELLQELCGFELTKVG